MTAAIGYGTEIGIGDGGDPESFTNVAEIIDITPPQYSADAVDVTTNDSTNRYREFIPGLRNGGTVTFTAVFTPSSSDSLITAFETTAAANYRITFSNATTCTFGAVVTGYSASVPLGDRMEATFTLQVSGQPTWA